jgi:hypothetical protein
MKYKNIKPYGVLMIIITFMISFQLKAQMRNQAIVSPELNPDQTVTFRI